MGLGSIYGLAGGALLGGLLGGSSPQVPYSGDITNALQQQGQNASALSQLGQNQIGAFNQFAPTANAQTQSYINLLNQNPYTDSYSAAQLANSTQGLNNAYGGADSQLMQQLQQRGLGGDGSTGGMNSTLAGGLTALNAGKANTLAQTANQIAMNAIQQRYANLGQAQGVATNYANQLYGQGAGATGNAGSLYGQQAQGYMGLSGQQQALNSQYQQQLSGLGSLLGYGIGGLTNGSVGSPTPSGGGGGIGSGALGTIGDPGGGSGGGLVGGLGNYALMFGGL